MKHIFVKSLAVGLAASALLSFGRFNALCGEIRSSVVRLHVLANSDTEEDQTLKLKVRDAVLQASQGLLAGIGDTESALAAVEGRLPVLQQAAADCVAAEGYDYPVSVGLEKSYFTTRTYDAVTLPAGWYTALQVRIGEGAGHNWWCVVFPPLCLGAAAEQADLDDLLDKEACDLVEQAPRYRIRFKLVEWLEKLFG